METEYRDDLYRRHYRMSYSNFKVLLNEIHRYWPSHSASKYVREPVDLEKALSFFLHRLGHGTSTQLLSQLYGVGESTVRKYCHLLVRVICKHMLPTHIQSPSHRRLEEIISDFQTLTLMPNVCGALDGTHIKLHYKPRDAQLASQYMCRHRFYSILLQGICDAQKVFWDVSINAPGGTDDATHWRTSAIFQKMQRREVIASPVIHLEGRCVQPYLLADSGYPASLMLVKPFGSGQGPDMHMMSAFDAHLSRGHHKIENAFGLLKNRWQILKSVSVELERVPRYVVACCVLHNFLQVRRELEPDDQVDMLPNVGVVLPLAEEESSDGTALRDVVYRECCRRISMQTVMQEEHLQ